MEITRAYNEAVIGGPKLKRAGWIMGGIGVGFLVLGGILYGAGVNSGANAYADDPKYRTALNLAVSGTVFMATGSALLIAGVPCLAVGYTRTGRWLPPKTLENAPANKVQELVAGNSINSAISITITPAFGPNQAGLGLVGTF